MGNNKNLADAINFGLTLIFFGIVFLFANLGFLNWEVIWIYVMKFWPLWMIFTGLKMIVGDYLVVRVIVKVAELIVMLGLLLLISVYNNSDSRVWNFSRNEVQEKSIIVESSSEVLDKREIKFTLGATEFLVEDINNDYHVRFDGTYYQYQGIPVIKEDYRGDDLQLEFSLDREKLNSNPFLWLNSDYEGADYEFAIGNQELDTDLDFKVGASKGTVDLEKLNLGELNIDLGAGKMEVNLGFMAIPNEEVVLKIGAGDLTLKLPEEVGFKIDYNVGAGSLILDDELDASGIGEVGVYKTENYEEADTKLNLEVEVGVGKVEVKRQ